MSDDRSRPRVIDAQLPELRSWGATHRQIAAMADSNTPNILKALADRGLVRAGDAKPTIWTAAR